MNWQLVGVIVTVIGIANGGLLWAVKFLLKRQSVALDEKFQALHEKDDGHDNAIQALRDDLANHKIDAARNYMHREDAVIYFSRFEQKIDAVWNFLHERFNRGS